MVSETKTAFNDGVFERLGRHFAAGEVVFRDGDEANGAYLLEEGRVRVVKRIAGAERGLRVLGRGDLFGEEGLLEGARRTTTAISLVPTRALSLDSNALESVLAELPSLGAHLVRQLVLRSRESEERIQISMLRDVQSKVVLGLLRAAQADSTASASEQTSLRLSPLELSARVGLDVEAVKRTVQQLRESDYLRVSEETLEIPDLEALRELYGLLETGEEIIGGSQR